MFARYHQKTDDATMLKKFEYYSHDMTGKKSFKFK